MIFEDIILVLTCTYCTILRIEVILWYLVFKVEIVVFRQKLSKMAIVRHAATLSGGNESIFGIDLASPPRGHAFEVVAVVTFSSK